MEYLVNVSCDGQHNEGSEETQSRILYVMYEHVSKHLHIQFAKINSRTVVALSPRTVASR